MGVAGILGGALIFVWSLGGRSKLEEKLRIFFAHLYDTFNIQNSTVIAVQCVDFE